MPTTIVIFPGKCSWGYGFCLIFGLSLLDSNALEEPHQMFVLYKSSIIIFVIIFIIIIIIPVHIRSCDLIGNKFMITFIISIVINSRIVMSN